MDDKKLLSANKRCFTGAELRELGLTYYRINKLVENGALVRLGKSSYGNTAYEGEYSDYAEAQARFPRAIVCMLTAAREYGLTTYLPDAVDLAIERDMKARTLAKDPHIRIWYFPQVRYETGIARMEDSAIYDIEKTVIDIIYYRNKVGIEETREVLTNYLARPDRDLVKLHRYAELLGCRKILATYLEVLLW